MRSSIENDSAVPVRLDSQDAQLSPRVESGARATGPGSRTDELVHVSFGFPRLDFFTVTSTLDIAREHARTGAPHGTLITAAHQSAGRGRRGARWRDDPGDSALMTFILRPEVCDLASAWRVPFVASLACVRALHALGVVEASVKWPNDLVVAGAKVGGLLVETGPSAYREPALLLGIGINVGQRSFADSQDYIMTPTSLRMVATRAGRADSPTTIEVIAAVASRLESAWREYWPKGEALIDDWRAHQVTGHVQRGIAMDGCEILCGIYRDLRSTDGAGMIEVPDLTDLIPVLPAPA